MKVAVKWGVIFGIVIIVWTLVIHFLGFYTTNLAAGQKADVVSLIIPIAAIVLALLERRKQLGRGLRIGESASLGVVTGAVSIPFTVGFLLWYHHVMNPQWLDLLIAYKKETMAAAGVSADVIALAEKAQRAGSSDGAQVIAGIIGTTIISLIIALLAHIGVRKAPPPADPSLRSG